MDADTIKNLIVNLGKQDFKRVVSLVLGEVFNFKAINVDGPNDGGTDWLTFSALGTTLLIGIQDTQQSRDWEAKAVADARKVSEKHNINRYMFITSRSHSNTTMRVLENRISTEIGITATCLSARELSEFIYEKRLTNEFLDAIGAPIASGITTRPDRQEILLHSFCIMSSESLDLKNSVYDDSIIITSRSYPKLSRIELIDKVIELLAFEKTREPILNKRIDALLGKGILVQDDQKHLNLSIQKQKELDLAERIYLAEFYNLASAQSSLMENEFGLHWSRENAEMVSVLLSRLFIKTQLESVSRAGAHFSSVGLVKHIGNPAQELKEYLSQVGIPLVRLDKVMEELVEQSKDLPIVKKLARTAIFIALEGADLLSSAKALGAPKWSDVTTMLDASAAIPFICASLYTPITDRFYGGTYETVKRLLKLKSKVTISHYYLNECASHLLQALNYTGLDEYEESLCYSENGYISNYYRLKRLSVAVPESITDYIASFARSSKEKDQDNNRWIRKVMTELQALFRQYDIEFEYISSLDDAYRVDFETEYAFLLKERNLHKKKILLNHDVFTLAHAKRQITQKKEYRTILTWDRIMIEVGQKFPDCGWVVSPDIAGDFLQPYLSIDEKHFCALAHMIARTQSRPLEVSARIIDTVVTYASQKLQDWEFRKKVEEFRKNLLERVDFSRREYANWIDSETVKFLSGQGVETDNLKNVLDADS